jgi:hypothetical protein
LKAAVPIDGGRWFCYTRHTRIKSSAIILPQLQLYFELYVGRVTEKYYLPIIFIYNPVFDRGIYRKESLAVVIWTTKRMPPVLDLPLPRPPPPGPHIELIHSSVGNLLRGHKIFETKL